MTAKATQLGSGPAETWTEAKQQHPRVQAQPSCQASWACAKAQLSIPWASVSPSTKTGNRWGLPGSACRLCITVFPRKKAESERRQRSQWKRQRGKRTANSQKVPRPQTHCAASSGSAETGTTSKRPVFSDQDSYTRKRTRSHEGCWAVHPGASQKLHPLENFRGLLCSTRDGNQPEGPGVPGGRGDALSHPCPASARACRPDNHGLFGK